MTGDRSRRAVSRDLTSIARTGIDVRRGEVTAIDPARRTARVDGEEIAADYIVVALGADLAPDAVPGFAEGAEHFFSLEAAERLRDVLRAFRGGRVAVVVSAIPYKCPGAPCEAALLLESYFRRRGITAEIAMWTPEPEPLPVIGGAASQAVLGVLTSRGIPYHAKHPLEAVEPQARQLRFAGGRTADYDLLVAVPPLRPPAAVKASGLLGESAWVPVDRATLRTKFEGVYAIGDIAGITLAHGKPLPKAGVFAHYQAETVAANIAAEIAGSAQRATFDGWGECFLETGDGRAGYGAGNFYAEPSPRIVLRPPARRWHWGKITWERYWWWKWL